MASDGHHVPYSEVRQVRQRRSITALKSRGQINELLRESAGAIGHRGPVCANWLSNSKTYSHRRTPQARLTQAAESSRHGVNKFGQQVDVSGRGSGNHNIGGYRLGPMSVAGTRAVARTPQFGLTSQHQPREGSPPMGIHHSEETHQQLVERVPSATGKSMADWYSAIDAGPAFSRFDERVTWLQDEYSISHGHATAIAHEYDKKQSQRRLA